MATITFSQALNLLFTVLMISIGQILFKKAAARLELENLMLFLKTIISNKFLIIALIIYGIATILWVIQLKSLPLNFAYPFMALAFIIVPILSHVFLNESLPNKFLLGSLLITIGITTIYI
jgi:undecaprenyl phosphate-alpha-L-ara4N flippase subunit ArnE